MLKRLVVAVDGTPASWQALALAGHLLDNDGVLAVVDVKDLMAMYQATATSNYTLSTGLDVTQYVAEWEKHAESIKNEVARRLEDFKGHYEWHVLEADDQPGGPAAALSAFAAEWKADGIVVGRHQGSTILEGVFGSFPRWLVTHSSLPVIVVPLQEVT